MRILIIAGPNGAGKTTFAREFLPAEAACIEFVNADCIAEGLSPLQPESVAWEAARLMLWRMRQLSLKRASFALETTLSTRSYLNHIAEWQAAGYQVELHFLKLPAAEWAVRRVAERVLLGGHSIPESTIRRRFSRGWDNFNRYKTVVDKCILYDSASIPPREMASGISMKQSLVEEESSARYTPALPPRQEVPVTAQPPYGGLAALTRAAEKAIARARAAGLEPIVRFVDEEEAEKTQRSNAAVK